MEQQNGVNPSPLPSATVPERSCGGRAAATFIVAATILLVGIVAWLAYLTAAKADRQEKAVTATASPQVALAEKVKAMEAALAAAKATADAASAKADKAVATTGQAKAIADNALKKAQAAVVKAPRGQPSQGENHGRVDGAQARVPSGIDGAIPTGGCRILANKDGVTLKQGGKKLGQGEEIAKIFNTDIAYSSDVQLVGLRKQFPNWKSSRSDHEGLCLAWRKATAEKLVQDPGNLN